MKYVTLFLIWFIGCILFGFITPSIGWFNIGSFAWGFLVGWKSDLYFQWYDSKFKK